MHDDARDLIEFARDDIIVAFTCAPMLASPHGSTRSFQRLGQRLGFRSIFARITDEDIDH